MSSPYSHDRDDVLLEYVQNLREDIGTVGGDVKAMHTQMVGLIERTARIEERQQMLKDTPARWAGAVAIIGMVWSLFHTGSVR